jgi:hypothetical protein
MTRMYASVNPPPATARAEIPSVRMRMRTHLWISWTRIAIDHEAVAKAAGRSWSRQHPRTPPDPEGPRTVPRGVRTQPTHARLAPVHHWPGAAYCEDAWWRGHHCGWRLWTTRPVLSAAPRSIPRRGGARRLPARPGFVGICQVPCLVLPLAEPEVIPSTEVDPWNPAEPIDQLDAQNK